MLRQVILIEVEVEEETMRTVVAMLAVAMVVAVGCGFCLTAVVAVVLDIDATAGHHNQHGGQNHHGTFARCGDRASATTVRTVAVVNLAVYRPDNAGYGCEQNQYECYCANHYFYPTKSVPR